MLDYRISNLYISNEIFIFSNYNLQMPCGLALLSQEENIKVCLPEDLKMCHILNLNIISDFEA